MKRFLLILVIFVSLFNLAPVFSGDPGVGKLLALKDVQCEPRAREMKVDSYGTILNAEGVTLECQGKPVDLVNGKISNGWLETKSFGMIMVKRTGIFVTAQQNEILKKAFK